jgi:CheY-like chemotaxis protein
MPGSGGKLPPIIVLAEDDEALRVLLAGLLRRNFGDHEVTAFGDGLEADGAIAELLDQGRDVAMVVSDLVMPRMDGLELLERLAERNPDSARIILTGQGALESAVQSLRLGVDDYLTKPFTEPELVRTLRRHLHSRALQRDNAQLRDELTYTYRYVARLTEALLVRFDRYLEPILELPSVTEDNRTAALRCRRAMDLVARAYRISPGGDDPSSVRLEATPLRSLVNAAIRMTETTRGEDAEVVVREPKPAPVLRIDASAARTALSQLIDNAMSSGTGRVDIVLLGQGRNWPDGITKDDLPSSVRQALARGYVGVSVRNTAGLTRDDEAYIRRVLSGRPELQDEFRGLGLPLARLYTTILGARIVFQWRSTRSEVTFTVLFPTGPDVQESEPTSGSWETATSSGISSGPWDGS